MKYFLLTAMAVFSLLVLSCDDDPVNNNEDKQVISLEQYKIAYTSVYKSDGVEIRTANLDGSNNTVLFDDAAMFFPVIDSVVYFQRNHQQTLMYNFYNQEVIDTIENIEGKSYWMTKIPSKDKVLMGPKAVERFKPVYTADLDGTQSSLFSDNCPGLSIEFSRDGQKILLEDELEYRVCNPDGSNKITIKDLKSIRGMNWGMDNGHLIWAKPMDVNITNIEILDIETSESKKLLTFNGVVHGFIRLSPDGKKMVFYDDENNLYMANSDGSGLKTLRSGGKEIKGDRFIFILEWAPDSRHLLSSRAMDFENKQVAGGLEVIDTKTGESTLIHSDDTVITAFWVKVK